MFSMCSKLTPRARIPETRITQFMQPCFEHDLRRLDQAQSQQETTKKLISGHKGCLILVIEPVHCGSNSILKVRFSGHPVVWCSWVYIELGRGRHKFLFGRLVGMVICRPKGCNRSVIKIQPRKVQIQSFLVHFSKFTRVTRRTKVHRDS